MKKLVFYSILILVFLAACTPNYDEADTLAPDLSADGQGITSVTVYLDGNGPPASRAMSKELALMGCDYFEVVFVGNKGGTLVTARGQWRIGEKAGVSDVYRTDAGVDYGNVSVSPATQETGSALLLAGKSDKTIMAIGKLKSTDTNITNATTKVTFELAAVKTGVNGTTLSLSSFQTAVGDTPSFSTVSDTNTQVTTELINDIYFLAFSLNRNVTAIKARYRFGLHSGNFSDYTDGLRVMSPGTVDKKYPSYTMPGGGNINAEAIILLDEKTTVTMDNNKTKDAAFNPDVEFTFKTDNEGGTISGSIFALTFEIPVYALVEACVWYIRPGYGVLKYELDDGLGGMGGAVLIKTGVLAAPSPSTDFIIRISHQPDKWRYRWTGAPDEGGRSVEQYDRVFRITDLVVNILRSDGTSDPGLDADPNVTSGVIANSALQFYIGNVRVTPGYILPDEFYGLIPVTVKYTQLSSGVSAEDKFFILVSSHYAYTDAFDYANPTDLITSPRIFNIANTTDFTNAFNNNDNNPNKILIFRLTANVNIDAVNVQMSPINGNPKSALFIFVAGTQNRVLGRGGSGSAGNSIKYANDFAGLGALYFGKWPFEGLTDSPLGTGTTYGVTYPFTVNAGNTYNGSTTVNSYNNKMITDQAVTGVGGGIYNVKLDTRLYPPVATPAAPPSVPGVSIIFPNLLY